MRKSSPFLAGFLLLVFSTSLPAVVCVPPTNGAWTTRTSFPPPGVVRSWGVYFPPNGKFYVMGGRISDALASDLLNPREYDPATDSWATKLAAFSNGQVNNMVGGVLNVGGTDSIIVVGGSAAGQTTATSETRLYDPVLDVITPQLLDPWPGNANGTTLPGGAAVYANKLYILGGFDINVAMTTTIYEYDPALAAGSRWSLRAAVLPQPLGYLPTATVGNFIYTLGGSSLQGLVLTDTNFAFEYDPVGDSISPVTLVPRAVAETRAVAQTDGTIWVLGGGRTAPNPVTQVDVFDPVGNSWTTGPVMLNERRNFAADSDPVSGRIWTVGGYNFTNAVTDFNQEFTCWIFIDGFNDGTHNAWSNVVP